MISEQFFFFNFSKKYSVYFTFWLEIDNLNDFLTNLSIFNNIFSFFWNLDHASGGLNSSDIWRLLQIGISIFERASFQRI